jgi:hypothetical protein
MEMNNCSHCGLSQDRGNGNYWAFVGFHYGTPDYISLCSACFYVYTGLPDMEIAFGKARKVKAVRPPPDDINTLPLFARQS